MEDRSRQVEQFAQEWAVAEQREDAAFLEGALVDDFVGIGPLGFMLTKEQWLGRYAGGLAYESFTLDEIEARLYGEAAVATCRQTQAGEFQGNDVGDVPRDPGLRGAGRPLAAGRPSPEPHRGGAVVLGPLTPRGAAPFA
jgi:hypothetical protein